MGAVEITLIIVGVIFLIGSFMVQDKLSAKDVEQIAKLSEEELKIIVDKKMAAASVKLEDSIDQTIDEANEVVKRIFDKQTNEKIMAISEYSDTVLESMNTTHNEIMFLYSMLNDKQKEITDIISDMQNAAKQVRSEPRAVQPAQGQRVQANFVTPLQNKKHPIISPLAELDKMAVQEKPPETTEHPRSHAALGAEVDNNQNIQILQLHRAGKSDVEIAKKLNCGLGEVKLVIGLYKGDVNNEA